MTVDAWDPKTFSPELSETLSEKSQLIFDYYSEDRRLMDEHLNSSPYQPLKQNEYGADYQSFREFTLTPVVANLRIRVWHYARLTNDEVDAMCRQLVPTSLDFLQKRLDGLVLNGLVGQSDAHAIYSQSPLHLQQEFREGRLWTTTVPVSHQDSGVVSLLENWGGESAYFRIKNQELKSTLMEIGRARIVEIETALADRVNGYSVAGTILKAWARSLGAPVAPSGSDLAITDCIEGAKIIRVHTKGDPLFEEIASTYPEGVYELLGRW